MPLRDGARPRGRGDGDSKGSRMTPVAESDSTGAGATTEVRSKIVMVGSCGCGKTALIHRYVQSTFLEVSITCTCAICAPDGLHYTWQVINRITPENIIDHITYDVSK